MSKLILVDAHGYLHRAYHALPSLTTSKGEPINAIYGFTRMILKLIFEQQPDYMVICFDAPGPVFREKIYPQYKATRKEIDEALRSQFPRSRQMIEAMGLASFEMQGFEADDLMAALAKKAEKDGLETIIVTGDKDILQLVNDHIRVLNEPKQIFFDRQKVLESWGVQPEQMTDVLALMGDTTDNIPGVPGIGEKTAVKLIHDFGSVEQLLKDPKGLSDKLKEKIIQNKEQLSTSKTLVQLKTDVPVSLAWDQCKINLTNKDAFLPLLQELGFHQIIKDLYSKGIFKTEKAEAEKFSAHYQTILSETQLSDLVQILSACKQIAVDVETNGLNVQQCELIGISLSWEKEFACYIPLHHTYLGVPNQLPLEKVIHALKPVLENENIEKTGHNLKFDFSVLYRHGIHMKNLRFDTMVASYCLDPSRTSYRLKDLAHEILGRSMVRIEELGAPKSKDSPKELFMDKVEIEKVSPYACADADCSLQLAQVLSKRLKEKDVEKLFDEIEMPLVEVLSDMEMQGIKADVPYLEKLNHQFSKEIGEIEREAYRLAGQEFNLGSPKQLAFILFEKLQLTPVKKTKTGYSTDEEVLNVLSAVHELPKTLLRHRELSKLKSTYIDGLLKEVDSKTSRIHTSFNQTGTSTGRLSSSEPNLQNIPIRSEYGRMIRRAFVPTEGTLFLSADYSQIDLRVLAHLSQDEALCKAFRSEADVHKATAAEVFHVPLEQVTDEQRKRAKAINFGIVYGQQAFGLSQSLGISMTEAQIMIEKYFVKYSGVRDWIEKTKLEARKNGFVKTLMGHVRYISEINSKNNAMRSFAERIATNTPVQGTSSDIIKSAMIQIHQKIKTSGTELKTRMLVQVHDDLLFEVPKHQVESTAKFVREKMENAIKLSIPLKVDLEIGTNWADMQHL